VALYCISSNHGACIYEWKKLGANHVYPSSAIIYVNEGGLYQCTVESNGNNKVASCRNLTIVLITLRQQQLTTELVQPTHTIYTYIKTIKPQLQNKGQLNSTKHA